MTDAIAALDAHLERFHGLAGQAARLRAACRDDAAAAYAQAAALYAWLNPTGLFASLDLEHLLAGIGSDLPVVRPSQRGLPGRVEVLHVATQAFQTGGHTQAIACWLDQDSGRRQRVCLTRQGTTPVPPKLRQRLTGADDILRLDTVRGGLLRRAALLRGAAQRADVVVLHTHPYDVVPVLAFATGGPPVVNVNHADHVFWLGTTVTTALMSMRGSGQELALARRGIDPARATVAPRPLDARRRTVSRADAKRALGIDPGTVLLTTAADGSKFRRIRGPAFLDLVVPVVAAHPDVVLLAAGPSADAEQSWRDAADRTGGRIRALGHLPDVSLLHQASDVYLDSYPFSSLTSLLEAGWYGTPAVTYRGHPDECAVLGADTEGIDDLLVRPSTPDEYAAALAALVEDSARRRDLGEATAVAIETTHTGEGWRRAVEGVYRFAATRTGRIEVTEPIRGTGELDVLLQLLMGGTGWYRDGVTGALTNNLGLLPLPDRVRAWWECTRAGDRPPPRLLVPEWLRPSLERFRPRSG